MVPGRLTSSLLLLTLLGCHRPAPVNVQEAEPEPSAFPVAPRHQHPDPGGGHPAGGLDIVLRGREHRP